VFGSLKKIAIASAFAAGMLSTGAVSASDGFDIQIVAGKDAKSSSVKVKGHISEVITDDDRKKLKITDSDLKDAVADYFGKRPKDAYVKSNTPWGDLYTKYNWTQVHRNVRVHSARIVEVTSKPTVLSQKTLINNSNVAGTFGASISESVSNTTESNWSHEDSFSVSQSFSYDVSFLGAGGGGETSMEYSHTWGQGGSESQEITVGSEQSVSVYLEPGQSVAATLNASRGSLKVQIVYEVYLTGSVAINYNPTYKGHHFWDLSVGSVMKSGGISNSYLVSETIEVGYYSNGEVVLGKVGKGK
jgi:hypothetical protein